MTIQRLDITTLWQSFEIVEPCALWVPETAEIFFSTTVEDPLENEFDVCPIGLNNRIYLNAATTLWLKSLEPAHVFIDAEIIG